MAWRYAIYYAPLRGSALERLGREWLARDVHRGCDLLPPELPEEAVPLWAEAVADPRRYGFHGTLKPPFRLREGTDEAALHAAVASLAAAEPAFEIEPLRLSRIGNFLALTPSTPSRALERLGSRIVSTLDPFRALPDEKELARRRASGLSDRQEELLQAWGYPYVMEEFRFHMTLTGRLNEEQAGILEPVLAARAAPACRSGLAVRSICMFEQPEPDAPFVLTERFPLNGSRHH